MAPLPRAVPTKRKMFGADHSTKETYLFLVSALSQDVVASSTLSALETSLSTHGKVDRGQRPALLASTVSSCTIRILASQRPVFRILRSDNIYSYRDFLLI